MKVNEDSGQTMQRVKVGMTGLALVLLLIGLASVIFSSASKETPVDVAGAAQPDVVANLSLTNGPDAAEPVSSEPLAELGVAPSTTTPITAAPTNTAEPAAPPPAQPRR
jgi:hypothetical protein